MTLIRQGDYCIDTSLRRLRITDPSTILPEYLALFLSSESGKKQILRYTSGSVIKVLSSPNLQELIIFVPSLEKQRTLIKKYEKMKADLVSDLIFSFPSLVRKSQKVSSQIEAVKKGPRSEKTIIETNLADLPFPIAYRYFLYQNSFGENAQARLKFLIDISEAIVYYLFSILLADQIHRLQIENGELAKSLQEASVSYSIDRKLNFIRLILKSASKDDIDLFVAEIHEVEIGICSHIHNELRNKISHIAAQPEAWCKEQLDLFEPKILRLIISLLFLKDYKLAVLSKLTRKDKQFQHHMTNFVGNSPAFTNEVVDFETPLDIDTSQVFLLDQNNNALDLHPWFIQHAWQSTGMHTHLCFIKQIKGNNQIKVESVMGAGEDTIEDTFEKIKFIFQDK